MGLPRLIEQMKKAIFNDGSRQMDAGYEPTDDQDVATRRWTLNQIVGGSIPDNSLTDIKLVDTAGNIKDAVYNNREVLTYTSLESIGLTDADFSGFDLEQAMDLLDSVIPENSIVAFQSDNLNPNFRSAISPTGNSGYFRYSKATFSTSDITFIEVTTGDYYHGTYLQSVTPSFKGWFELAKQGDLIKMKVLSEIIGNTTDPTTNDAYIKLMRSDGTWDGYIGMENGQIRIYNLYSTSLLRLDETALTYLANGSTRSIPRISSSNVNTPPTSGNIVDDLFAYTED